MFSSENRRVLVFSGRANQTLTGEICEYMDVSLGKTVIRDFSDKEIYVQIEENVRGGDVFVVQSTCFPCLLYTSPSPRDPKTSRMPSSA